MLSLLVAVCVSVWHIVKTSIFFCIGLLNHLFKGVTLNGNCTAEVKLIRAKVRRTSVASWIQLNAYFYYCFTIIIIINSYSNHIFFPFVLDERRSTGCGQSVVIIYFFRCIQITTEKPPSTLHTSSFLRPRGRESE